MSEREPRREAPSQRPVKDDRERQRARPSVDEEDERDPGKTPGSAESGGLDSPERSGPGKTPGNAEG